MNRPRRPLLLGMLILFCALATASEAAAVPARGSLSAGGPARPAQAASADQLGTVNFPTSCSAAAQPLMVTGLVLLHSFQYMQARETFRQAAQRDPRCAMAHWGEATSLYHQLWDFPQPETIAEGHKEIEEAQKTGAPTERERGYISAAAAFFQDSPKLTHLKRMQAYSSALVKLHEQSPDDIEAAAFYALSLVALAYEDGPNETAHRRKAIAILQPLFRSHPDDPGLAHYLIHATDTPELAPVGLEAARRYAKIAPDSSHALHMPSHIFRRLGLWQEVIDSNLVSAAAAAKATEAHAGDASYQFHAMDFLDYAYLQSGQEAKARDLVEEVKHVPGASKGDIIDEQNLFSARNALELHRWKEAGSLAIPQERLDWQDITYWTRAIGAARSGDVVGAQADVQKLSETIKAREADQRTKGYKLAAGKSVDQLEAEGWLAYVEGKPAEAVTKLRSAADREVTKHSDPFAMPAREMLADLLLELKRPAEALVEYEAVSRTYSNRFDALYGSARAAQLSGDRAQASQYYAELVAISAASADRSELAEAKTYLGQN